MDEREEIRKLVNEAVRRRATMLREETHELVAMAEELRDQLAKTLDDVTRQARAVMPPEERLEDEQDR